MGHGWHVCPAPLPHPGEHDHGYATQNDRIAIVDVPLEQNKGLEDSDMSEHLPPLPDWLTGLQVMAGEDIFGEQRSLGISTIAFKVVPPDPNGILILENTFHARGGPARHLHLDQDEWFYAVEGDFLVEVGGKTMTLHPGDSLLAPRRVPHVWAYVGDTTGRMLIAFLPAGRMESFFREVTKANAMPPNDPKLWQAHGMELVGPPLPVG